jgi:hypothetical protein
MTPSDQTKADRLYQWLCETYEPETDYEKTLLRAVANARTLVERCQTLLFGVHDASVLGAELDWDSNQAIAAEQLALRLSKAPALVSRQLARTSQGLDLLEDRWIRLGQAIDENGEWTESQRQLALDLLGVPREFREGRTEIDPQDGQDARAVAQAIVAQQLQKLRNPKLRASTEQCDAYARDMATSGYPTTISPDVRLLERYQAMHHRRADRAMAEFKRLRDERLGGHEAPKAPPRPVAAAVAAAMKAAQAQASASSTWAQAFGPRPAPAPQNPHSPQRDREAEQARKKAEYDARKQQKQQQK